MKILFSMHLLTKFHRIRRPTLIFHFGLKNALSYVSIILFVIFELLKSLTCFGTNFYYCRQDRQNRILISLV